VQTAVPADGPIVTLCPHRFKEAVSIYQWTGEVVLDTSDPDFVQEVPFLERDRHSEYEAVWGTESSGDDVSDSDDDVGRIDGILTRADVDPEPSGHDLTVSVDLSDWCGLELQSVYFSGDKMSLEYTPLTEVAPPRVPFPNGRRRPDFRSSSAKRLLPQLQTKIPSLRRWGKKMAVVVDEAFFYEMAEMETVDHISNCDIVWMVVGYERDDEGFRLCQRSVHFTTLEDAVIGLTAGKPVAREHFEQQIAKKLKEPHIHSHIEALGERLDRLMQRRKGLETTIRFYIDRMKKIRTNRARQNERLDATTDNAKRQWLQRSIEIQDRQLNTLWTRRDPVEDKEARLKDRCKQIRDVRARLNAALE